MSYIAHEWSCGVMVSIPDSESGDLSSNLSGTCFVFVTIFTFSLTFTSTEFPLFSQAQKPNLQAEGKLKV